jgi:hypothetical protein
MLTNLSVLPDGEIRMVWAADDGPDGEQNIYGATFGLPPHCPSLELGASVTWNPGHCFGKNFCTNGFFAPEPERLKPDPPIEFPLTTKLPVAEGNAASGIAALLFSPGGESADTIGLAVASAQPSGVTRVKMSLPILSRTP